MSVTPTFTLISGQSLTGRDFAERRATFNGSFRLPLKRFTIGNRNLIERRFRANATDSTRFRSRLLIEHLFSIRKKSFNIFASNEIFLRFDGEKPDAKPIFRRHQQTFDGKVDGRDLLQTAKRRTRPIWRLQCHRHQFTGKRGYFLTVESEQSLNSSLFCRCGLLWKQ